MKIAKKTQNFETSFQSKKSHKTRSLESAKKSNWKASVESSSCQHIHNFSLFTKLKPMQEIFNSLSKIVHKKIDVLRSNPEGQDLLAHFDVLKSQLEEDSHGHLDQQELLANLDNHIHKIKNFLSRLDLKISERDKFQLKNLYEKSSKLLAAS